MRVRAIFKCSFCRGSFFALANGLWIKKVSKWTVLVQLKELLSFSFFFPPTSITSSRLLISIV